MSKEARQQARREAFIDAGIAVIGDVGIAETKVRALCAHADLTERYFYESFPTLDGFARSVVEAVAFKVGLRLLEKVMPVEGDGHAKLRTVAQELVRIFSEEPGIGRILLIETLRAGGALTEIRQNLLYGAATLMQMWLDDSEQVDTAALVAPLIMSYLSGQVPDVAATPAPDMNTVAIAGASAELLVAWVNGRLDITAEQLAEYVLEFIDQTVAWQKNQTPSGKSHRR